MPPVSDEPVAWINGHLQPFAESGLPLWDLGIVAGAAVTEMARTFRHQTPDLPAHLERLIGSCAALQFPLPWSMDDLMESATRVVRHNCRLISPDDDLGITLFVTAGVNATYLSGQGGAGSTVIHTFPLPFAMWRKGLREGVCLRIPTVRQIPSDCFPVEHKVRNRLHWWLADQEAARLEPGSRALLLDHQGRITETSTSCLFVVREGEVITPAHNVLNSLSRERVESILRQRGIPCRRSDLRIEDIADISEAFLSSTPVCLLPVRQIDGRPVADRVPGPIFETVLQAWSQDAGLDLREQILREKSPTEQGQE